MQGDRPVAAARPPGWGREGTRSTSGSARFSRDVRFRSRASKLAALVLLLLPSASGWAQSGAPEPAAPVEGLSADWDVFAKKGCAGCHRVRGLGDGVVGPDLGHMGSDAGVFEIFAAMWNHLPRMRQQMRDQTAGWPSLSPQELSSVIALLFTAQHQAVPGDPGAGARLFGSKGCERCHAASGSGDAGGPPLETLKRSSSPVLLSAAMWNHGVQMGLATGVHDVGRTRLDGTELRDIAAYMLETGGDPRGETAPTVLGVPDRGQRLFAEKGCARCHAVGGAGTGRGPRLGPHPSGTTATELAAQLWNHGPVVRVDATARRVAVSRVTGQEMADLIAYLQASYYFDRVQGDAGRGRRLVQDKGCLRCHSIYNAGGRLAPDFATSNVVSSQLGQLSAMWNHGRYMENEARRAAVVLPSLTARELSDITRYLAGLGSGAPVGPARPRWPAPPGEGSR